MKIIAAIVVPLIYVVTGLIGLYFFAAPHSYATTVFLPSGIAIGAIFLFGHALLPSVFVGSLILNPDFGHSMKPWLLR